MHTGRGCTLAVVCGAKESLAPTRLEIREIQQLTKLLKEARNDLPPCWQWAAYH